MPKIEQFGWMRKLPRSGDPVTSELDAFDKAAARIDAAQTTIANSVQAQKEANAKLRKMLGAGFWTKQEIEAAKEAAK